MSEKGVQNNYSRPLEDQQENVIVKNGCSENGGGGEEEAEDGEINGA